MKKYYFALATILCLLCSCKSENSFEGEWRKTQGSYDKILESGLLDFVNDSVCNVYSRKGKIVGQSTFHSKIVVGETQAMFLEGYFGVDFWSKSDYTNDESEKAIKAFFTVILPEIDQRRKETELDNNRMQL